VSGCFGGRYAPTDCAYPPALDSIELVTAKTKIKILRRNEKAKPPKGNAQACTAHARTRSGSRSISSMILQVPELCKAGVIKDEDRGTSSTKIPLE
jgi:hypothetical protein